MVYARLIQDAVSVRLFIEALPSWPFLYRRRRQVRVITARQCLVLYWALTYDIKCLGSQLAPTAFIFSMVTKALLILNLNTQATHRPHSV